MFLNAFKRYYNYYVYAFRRYCRYYHHYHYRNVSIATCIHFINHYYQALIF